MDAKDYPGRIWSLGWLSSKAFSEISLAAEVKLSQSDPGAISFNETDGHPVSLELALSEEAGQARIASSNACLASSDP